MKKEATDLGAEIADASISSLINSTALEGLPIFGMAVKALTAVGSFRDTLYLAKLARFVQNLDAIPVSKQEEFRAFLKVDSGEKQRLGRILLLLLEQLSDVEKADLMAMVFIAYLDGKIDSEILRRMWDAIAHAFLDDLLVLLGDKSAARNSHMPNLVRTGLTEVKFGVSQARKGVGNSTNSQLGGNGAGGMNGTRGVGTYQSHSLTDLGTRFINAVGHGRSQSSR